VSALELSIIIPVFNEAKSLKILHSEILTALNKEAISFEILFIDDSSTDNSVEIIKDLISKHSNILGFALKKNSKKAGALKLGFKKALGKIVVTMDADLQDDPSEIIKLINEIKEGADAVNAWKKDRQDSLSKKLPSNLANLLTSFLTGSSIKDMNSGFKAYRAEVLSNFNFPGSSYRFIPHLLNARGYDVREIAVNHRKRLYGETKFNLLHRLRGAFDMLTIFFLVRFQHRPMHFFGLIGFGLLALGIAFGIYLSALWLIGYPIGTRPLLLLSILLTVLGVQVIIIGLIGELITLNSNSLDEENPHNVL